MKTKLLDLNAYGVEEMSVAEMQKTDGGFLTLWNLYNIFRLGVIIWENCDIYLRASIGTSPGANICISCRLN